MPFGIRFVETDKSLQANVEIMPLIYKMCVCVYIYIYFIGMPQDLYNLWYPDSYPFTDVLCVMEGVVSETAANATVLTITAFTVERYIAICHPFR